jgi:hypothetical protein
VAALDETRQERQTRAELCVCETCDDCPRDDPPTKVVFRQWRAEPRTIIALFPEIPADLNGYTCESYEHFGQHGGADYEGVVSRTLPVPRSQSSERYAQDVDDLSRELESLGYVLHVVRRCTPAMRRERFAEARRICEHTPAGA